MTAQVYPDISDIFARKVAGRRALAAKSFAERVPMLQRLRDRAGALRAAVRPVTPPSPVGERKDALDT